MPPPEGSRKPDPIEQDFLNALQRLQEGKPQNKKLKAKASAGKLRINTVNVALEAGRSRTLIALEDCRYPKVRAAVKLAQGGKKESPSTYTQLIANLRADLATVKAEKRLLETTMAAHVLARRKAEVIARRDAAEAARLRKHIVELEKIVHFPCRVAALPRLVLIRGLPGSGKTTKAMRYVNDGYKHLESDQFFMVDGEYRFDGTRLPEALAWCLDQARKALDAGEFVCVANVFATVEDVKPYTELDVDYLIVETNHSGDSIRNVPATTLRALAATWVPTDLLVGALKGKASVAPITTKNE
ncbi:AAA family ATPase [Niveibacterium sp.]|uniref:AAA family ATPase n=1 Tax=Niveibacterium sp. TaxID=2017444 RepID=UPI0035B391D2